MLETRSSQQQREALAQFGEYIKDVRNSKQLSLAQLASKIGFTATYMMEIEHGKKEPSDEFIHNFSEFFGLNENTLFGKLDRVSLLAKQELEQHIVLQELLKDMGQSKLSKAKKVEIYEGFYRMIRLLLNK